MKASDNNRDISNVNSTQPPVKNVEAAFARISGRGDYFYANTDDKIPRWLYTQSVEHNNTGYQNHFQGIQRLQERNYVVISGGDWRNSKSDLFVVKMGSRPDKGPWWSNIVTSLDPPQTDKIVAHVKLDEKHWHAGGMDIQGDVLIVPIEYAPPNALQPWPGFKAPDHGALQSSKILFYDLTNPEQPRKFPFEINRNQTKAGAVAITKLPNGYFLVAAWTDSDTKPVKEQRLEFYLSKTTSFNDGFQDKLWTWKRTDVLALGEQERDFKKYQSINFILQEDGQLYLVGLHNTSEAAPVFGGSNYADLYFVEIDPEALTAKPKSIRENTPKITKVANRRFECKNRQCNFDAGTGVYISEGELFVYSTFHFRGTKGIIKFNEYLPPYKGIRRVRDKDAWIEMFQEEYFQGRRLPIRGTGEMTQQNFDNLRVEKKGFGDQASSIRFQLPKDTKCILYEDKDFKKKLPLELIGSNDIVELPKLDKAKGKISSMKFV